MLAEDTFGRLYSDAVRALEQSLEGIATSADVEIERGAGFWRGRMIPHQANACPFECVLHTTQMFDLEMASLKTEGQPMREPRLLVDLARAAIAGTVIVRHFTSASVGLELARELRAPLSDGSIWTLRHKDFAAGTAGTDDDAIAADEHFVPYSRG